MISGEIGAQWLTLYIKNHTVFAGLAKVPQQKLFEPKFVEKSRNTYIYGSGFLMYYGFLVSYPKGANLPELLHSTYSYTCMTPCRYVCLYQFILCRVSEERKLLAPL
jgi:hypothetical protein